MSKNLTGVGGSLPVENVQVLAGKELKNLPNRYVRPELEHDDVVPIDNSLEIPVIDLSRLLDQQYACDELAKFHSACLDWGFFQLINHGVREEVIEKMKVDTEDFFRLPFKEKNAYRQLPNGMEGYGQAFVTSEEQKLDWADMHFLITKPVQERNMRFWPTSPTSFRETMEKYSMELQKVAMCLTGMMAKNLGLESEILTKPLRTVFNREDELLPSMSSCGEGLGLSPHSDATGLTLLIQVNEVNGLHIKKDEKWVPIKPILGAFVVNIGDVIEIMSNGIYKSIEHRAVINTDKERLSIAAFHDPEYGTKIGPLPDLVKENGVKYKTIDYEDYLIRSSNIKLDGKSLLDQMKL
uniref:S-norcoclaurine synthase 1 n=1 Tax=Coptis japonica TaxID=3442 RepID=NCS1_COPJA|nr:RecName: Full=S-norcoclaurine synthase 1; Short=CjNCS1 [Coptis japonica]ADK56103.1 2OG/Fe(II)-dependent dioxygenase-like protein [synthetic construct]BAF45337.1 norcoclaurine synthase [Coptis japonica var. dissecta]